MNNKAKFGLGLVGVVAVIALLSMFLNSLLPEEESENPNPIVSEKNIIEQVAYAKKLKKQYSESLGIYEEYREEDSTEKRVSYEVRLLNKKPYTSEKVIKQAVKDYIAFLKWKEEAQKKRVTNVKVVIYDREIFMTKYRDIELFPKGTYRYQLSESVFQEGVGKEAYVQLDSANVYLDRKEFAMDTKKYKKYKEDDFTLQGQYEPNKSKHALTNAEVRFLLKLYEYNLVSTGDFDRETLYGAIKKYLVWEGGLLPNMLQSKEGQDYVDGFYREVKSLQTRFQQDYGFSDIGEYERDIITKEYYKNRPQLALFLNKNYITKTVAEAKRKVVKIKPEMLQVYIDEAKTILANQKDVTENDITNIVFGLSLDEKIASGAKEEMEKEGQVSEKEPNEKKEETQGNNEVEKEEADNEADSDASDWKID